MNQSRQFQTWTLHLPGHLLNDPVAQLHDSLAAFDKPSWTVIDVPTHTLLANGNVLVVLASGNLMIYTPSTNLFSKLNSTKTGTRVGFSITRLRDGKVLMLGGLVASWEYRQTLEMLTSEVETVTLDEKLPVPRAYHTATLLYNGKVLICGGENESGEVGIADIYDPESNNFSRTAVPYVHPSSYPWLFEIDDSLIERKGRTCQKQFDSKDPPLLCQYVTWNVTTVFAQDKFRIPFFPNEAPKVVVKTSTEIIKQHRISKNYHILKFEFLGLPWSYFFVFVHHDGHHSTLSMMHGVSWILSNCLTETENKSKSHVGTEKYDNCTSTWTAHKPPMKKHCAN